jgi:hypothetical protein
MAGLLDYAKMVQQLQGGLLGNFVQPAAWNPFAKRNSVDPIAGLEGAGRPREGGGRGVTPTPKMRDYTLDELAKVHANVLANAKASGRKYLTPQEEFQLFGIEQRLKAAGKW